METRKRTMMIDEINKHIDKKKCKNTSLKIIDLLYDGEFSAIEMYFIIEMIRKSFREMMEENGIKMEIVGAFNG